MLKHNSVKTTLRLSYHGYKNLTHMGKRRQVKRPKWLRQLLRWQFACLLLFQTAKSRKPRNCHAKGC